LRWQPGSREATGKPAEEGEAEGHCDEDFVSLTLATSVGLDCGYTEEHTAASWCSSMRSPVFFFYYFCPDVPNQYSKVLSGVGHAAWLSFQPISAEHGSTMAY